MIPSTSAHLIDRSEVNIREFKIRRLRTTATDKHATAHDHFSRVALRLRWVVELFRVVRTTENILLVFCRLGNSSFQFTCFKWEGSEICNLCQISAQIYAINPLLWLHFYLAKLIFKWASDWQPRGREIMRVIYFIFALVKFQCLFELISVSFYLLSYFEKIAHMSVVWAYVSLWLCMLGCLLQEPIRLKVLWVDAWEPMRSWHLFKHGIGKGRTRALWDLHLDPSQFFRLLLRVRVFGIIT